MESQASVFFSWLSLSVELGGSFEMTENNWVVVSSIFFMFTPTWGNDPI